MHRREFLKNTVCSAASASIAGFAVNQQVAAGEFTGRIKKAVKYHMIREELSAEDKFKLLIDLGYDGVEPRAMLEKSQADEVKAMTKASEKTGLPIHGVVNSANPNLIGAIDQAKHYGATSILHVVRYNSKISYQQNYKETTEIIRKAVDHAEKQGISILIENVWATYLIAATQMARFIDQFDSPFVQVYFDVGNVVRWGHPQHWIEVLGKRCRKLDIKEYDMKIAMNEGMRKAFAVPLGEGSVDWKKVRAELTKIDYKGWATAEVSGGDHKRLADVAAQMDQVLDL